MFNVYMDDVRPGPCNEWGTSPAEWKDWVVCRNVDQVKHLLYLGLVNKLSLDHDMGDNQPTGMDLVKWMCEYNIFPRDLITVHSANPIGAQNMQSMLDQYNRWAG